MSKVPPSIIHANLREWGAAEFSIQHRALRARKKTSVIPVCRISANVLMEERLFLSSGFLRIPNLPPPKSRPAAHLTFHGCSSHTSNCLTEPVLRRSWYTVISSKRWWAWRNAWNINGEKKIQTELTKKTEALISTQAGNLSDGTSKVQASDVGEGQEIKDWFHCWLPLPWVAHVPPHFPVCKMRPWMLETVKFLKMYSEKLGDFYFINPEGTKGKTVILSAHSFYLSTSWMETVS